MKKLCHMCWLIKMPFKLCKNAILFSASVDDLELPVAPIQCSKPGCQYNSLSRTNLLTYPNPHIHYMLASIDVETILILDTSQPFQIPGT